jgi:hypothetical protein
MRKTSVGAQNKEQVGIKKIEKGGRGRGLSKHHLNNVKG